MSAHKKINVMLYDYLKNEVSVDERATIEKHLALCKECRVDVQEIRSTLQLVPHKEILPSDEHPVEYWQRFVDTVDNRLKTTPSSTVLFWSNVWNDIISFVILRPVAVSAASGVVALLIVGVVLWQLGVPLRLHEADNHSQPSPEISSKAIEGNIRMANYFRKSKMLLVGITNMKLNENQQVDLSSERKYSRALLQEARYLKNQPIDNRSAKLIGDLEKILIQLANAKDQGDAPDVEIIRGGIHQENLLFKIRVAESVFDSARVSPY